MTATVEHATPPTATALAALDPDAFTALVHASIGNDADPAVWDALTHPSVIARTRKCLGSLHADVLAQLALANAELDDVRGDGLRRGEEGKADYFAAKNAQVEWRRRTAGFRRLVEKRIALVKARTTRGPATQPSPTGYTKNARKHNRAALERLARAVAGHQQKVLSGDGDESDDETLWGCLSSITAITSEGELPLTEWLEYLDDLREDDEQ